MGGFGNDAASGSQRLTPTPRAPGLPPALADTYQAGGVDIRNPQAFAGDRRALEATGRWAARNPYDAAVVATAPIPGVGDAVGVANDLRTFATDPESRTPVNFGLSALGALPFVPSGLGVLHDVYKNGFGDWYEVFRNPTSREMRDILRDSGAARLAYDTRSGDWYAWGADKELHGPTITKIGGYDSTIDEADDVTSYREYQQLRRER